jgi:Na+/H+-translocating membrane pyrophosphatase
MLEAGSAIALPAAGMLLVANADDTTGPFAFLAMASASVILAIGCACWRTALAHVEGDTLLAHKIMAVLKHSRTPAQIAAIAGSLGGLGELALDKAFTASAIAAIVFGGLAVLEYVNYYIVQLQHFDHWPDFKRLISGRGFRKPYLAKAIVRTQKARLARR